MKRFRKFRDPRFALTTLQNPSWEVRTRAELIQAAQDALAHHPDAAELPFAGRPAAPGTPPPATTIPPPAAAAPLAEPEPEPQAQAEPQAEPQPEPQPQPQSEPEPQLELQPEPEPASRSNPPVESQAAPPTFPLHRMAAKHPAKRNRKSKPQHKLQPPPVHLSKIIPGEDAAEFVAEALDRHANQAAGPHRNQSSAPPALDRHSRKCAICHHPRRADIEEEFVNWRDADLIRNEYELPNYHTVYRHARAQGLYERRRGNLRFAAELLIEHADQAQPDANTILRAIHACARINDRGEWVEPVKRVIVTNADHQVAFAPAPQPAPQPEFQQLVPAAVPYPQSPTPISNNTEAVPPFLINGPTIRK